MKLRLVSLGLLALAFVAAVGAAPLGACAGGSETPSTGGAPPGTGGSGGGPSSSSSSSSSSSGGDGGGGGMPDSCSTLCGHISQINCAAWTTCPADCANKLGAPSECTAAFDALAQCWTQNLGTFGCTATQLLPPSACKALEDAFYDCVTPDTVDTSCICGAGVGSSGQDKCARKTACGINEYAAVCQVGASGDWDCSCYNHQTLLGTCTEPAAQMPHCDNMTGCCAAYFCVPLQ